MKRMIIAMLLSSGLTGGAAAEVSRPVAVNLAMGELSDASGAIFTAVSAGDADTAEKLLSGLYSGGHGAESAVPVYADKCCCPPARPAAPAAAPAETATPPAADGGDAQPPTAAYDGWETGWQGEEAGQSTPEDEAREQKEFDLGVTILTIALLLLILL